MGRHVDNKNMAGNPQRTEVSHRAKGPTEPIEGVAVGSGGGKKWAKAILDLVRYSQPINKAKPGRYLKTIQEATNESDTDCPLQIETT